MEYSSQNQCYNNMSIPKVMKSLTEFFILCYEQTPKIIRTTRTRKIKQLINFIRKIFRELLFTFSSN